MPRQSAFKSAINVIKPRRKPLNTMMPNPPLAQKAVATGAQPPNPVPPGINTTKPPLPAPKPQPIIPQILPGIMHEGGHVTESKKYILKKGEHISPAVLPKDCDICEKLTPDQLDKRHKAKGLK